MAPDSFVDSNEVPEARICSGEDKGRKQTAFPDGKVVEQEGDF